VLKKQIAFFDFDGTITTRDSFLELIKFQKGKLRFYIGFLINAPVLIAYKMKLISNDTAKQVVLRFFFNRMPYTEFQDKCDRFASTDLLRLVRPKALVEIKALQDKGTEVVIVSASAENWIKKWSDNIAVSLIATRLEEKNGLVTGRIKGANCYGEEKVKRIKSLYDLSQYGEIYCYGDTGGDKPMLAMGTRSFYKPFR
jgi:HAD superfamily hydrolase (TIGR01490 family)